MGGPENFITEDISNIFKPFETKGSFSEGKNLSQDENKIQPENVDGKFSPQEKAQKILNDIKTGTPEQVKIIINNAPIELLVLAYKNPQYIQGLRSLHLDNKIAIIESLGENKSFLDVVRQGDQVDTDIRITIKREIFGSNLNSENKEWIKKIIMSGEKSRSAIWKIEKYFIVSQIVNGLGYDRNIIKEDKKVIRQATTERQNYPDDYQRIGDTTNETIARCFLNKMMNVGKKFVDGSEKGIITQENINIIRRYAEVGGRFNGLIQTLSYMDEESQKRINNLGESGLIMFLDNLSKDPDINQKISKIMGYQENPDIANKVAQLLVTEEAIQNTLKVAEESVLENPNFLKSQEFQEFKFQAFNSPFNITKAKKVYQAKLIKENSDIFSNLNREEEKTKLEKIWNDLTTDEKLKYQQEARELTPEESKVLLKKEFNKELRNSAIAKAKISAKKEGVVWKNLTENQRQLRIALSSNDAAKEFVSPYLNKEEKVVFQQELEKIQKQNNEILYLSAQKYGFTEDLKQIRGSEYYTQVEQSYISTQTIDNKLSSLDISTKVPVESQQDWKKFSNNIINNDVFNQEESKLKELPEIVFSDLQKFKPIPVEYQSLLGKDGNLDISLMQKQNVPQDLQQKLLTIYSPDKIKTSVEQQLLQETNDVMKSHLTQQVVQFLQESLNMEIDQQGKENIIEQFKDIKNNNKNQNLIVEGNYQGQKIRFVYDLTTGEFKSNDRMSKNKGESGIQINGDSLSSLGIRGPNIVDMLDTAKNLDYQTITNKANGDISKYNQLCEKNFSLKQPNYPLDNKDILKTQYLKTILSQEMMDIVGLSKPESQKTIDTKFHPIYKKIYDSVTNYSLEELQEMRKNMKKLISLNNQIKDSSLSENEEDLAKETKNKAKKVLLTLFKEQKKEQQKTEDNRFADYFVRFFSSFDSLHQRGSEQVKVIDPKKILAFIADVEKTTYDGAVAYDQTKLQENMSSYIADSDLDKQLDQMTYT